jgi:SAM-dependent methyltransferase
MYKNFAYIYDELLYDINSGQWADYLGKIFLNNNIKSGKILDLACGTGNMSIQMSKKGFEVTGVDLSADMLTCAIDKSIKNNLNIEFINHDMVDFRMKVEFDGIICLLDSVNYILKNEYIEKFFMNVYNMLDIHGIFIFDINTEYKLKNIISNNIFYEISDEVNYLWTNNFNENNNICEFDLTFFVKEGELYRKYNETHYERAYNNDELIDILEKCNFEIINIFDELQFVDPKINSERIFFVCRKN